MPRSGRCRGEEAHPFYSFDSRLTVRIGRLQRVRLDELSRRRNQAKHADWPDRGAGGDRTPSIKAHDLLRSRHPACRSSRRHLLSGDKQASIGSGEFRQAVNRDLRYDFAGFRYGHRSRQQTVAKLWCVRVIVSVIAPGYLRLHLEQPGLWIDTLLGFLPASARRRRCSASRSGEQNAGDFGAVEDSRRRSDLAASDVLRRRNWVEQGRPGLMQTEGNDPCRSVFEKRRFRGDASSREPAPGGFRRPAEPLLGIEHILHLPGAVIFRLTAGTHRKGDLEIVTAAGISQGVTVSRAGKKQKDVRATFGCVDGLDWTGYQFERIARDGRHPRCALAKSRKR